MYISEVFLSAWKMLCFMIYGEDTMWLQSGCELHSLADSHLSNMMLFECPSGYLDMIINIHSVWRGTAQVGVWQVHPMSNYSAKWRVRNDQLLADSLLLFWHWVTQCKCQPSKLWFSNKIKLFNQGALDWVRKMVSPWLDVQCVWPRLVNLWMC